MENNENNVQNQEKKQKKGLPTPLVVVMLIAVLIIGIGGGYLLSKKDSLFNKNETKSNNNTGVENNITDDYTMTVDEAKDNSTANGSNVNKQQNQTTSNSTNTKTTSEGYAKYYSEKIKGLDYVDNSTKYGLLYVNQNNIPYLVVDTGGDLSIYKINNNTVVTIKERDSYGTHGRDGYDYIEGTNIMRDYCTFEEGYAYEIYDELFNYKYCVECTFNGEYRYSESGEKKVITEEEFNNLSYNNSNFKHLRTIADKNKQEMIKLLENN